MSFAVYHPSFHIILMWYTVQSIAENIVCENARVIGYASVKMHQNAHVSRAMLRLPCRSYCASLHAPRRIREQ